MANRTLIKNAAHILTMDPRLGEIRNGDLLIEDKRIADVGVNLGQVDARLIDARNMIVIPGFIDTHRHTWQALARNIASDWTLAQYFAGIRVVLSPHYTPEDMYLGNLIGALEALDAGITTLLDWSHNNNSPEHADAAIRGLQDAGLRAIYGYGNSAEEWFPVNDLPTNFDDVRRVQKRYFSSDDQLVTLAFAARGEFATIRQTIRDFQEARKLGLRITMHAGSGLWGMNGTLIQMAEQGLLKNDTTYVHCNTLRDEEFKLIGDTGGTASIAPEVELQMGHGFLATLKLLGAGVRPSVSIDVTTSIGGDMFGAMRALLMGTRAVVNNKALEERKLVDPLPLMCTDVPAVRDDRGRPGVRTRPQGRLYHQGQGGRPRSHQHRRFQSFSAAQRDQRRRRSLSRRQCGYGLRGRQDCERAWTASRRRAARLASANRSRRRGLELAGRRA